MILMKNAYGMKTNWIYYKLLRNIATSIEQIESETTIYESEEKFRLLANNIPGTVYLTQDAKIHQNIS
jgi:hypothetical protein